MSSSNNNLSRIKVYYANKKGKYGSWDFNCWGATLYVLGVNKKLVWTNDFEMDKFLEENTVEVYRPRVGDILVIRRSLWLEHTAVYLGKRKYFHKRGPNTSEITDLRGVRKIYKGNITQFRRMK